MGVKTYTTYGTYRPYTTHGISGSAVDNDKRILELALKQMSLALDDLAAECTDDIGNPKEPSRKALMRARGMLPSYCRMALAR